MPPLLPPWLVAVALLVQALVDMLKAATISPREWT
jgi:hypothetical protein